MKTKFLFLFLLFFMLFICNVIAYSIHNVDFGYIENGKSYERDLVIMLSPRDTNSYFKIDKGGDLAPFLLVTPMEFELDKGQKQVVKIGLVTEGLYEGEYTGWIIARGQEPIASNGMIGYTISLKTNIKATIMTNEEKKFNSLIFYLMLSIIIVCVVFLVIKKFSGKMGEET